MVNLSRGLNRNGVTFVDVLIVTIFAFFTLFITYAWNHRLAPVFLLFAFFTIVLYIISASTGVLGTVLNLKRSTWTLGALVSIPLWILVSLIPSTTTDLNFDSTNWLVKLFGQTFFDNATQSFIVPVYETIILIGFLLGIFIRSRNPDIDRNRLALLKERGSGAVYLVIFVSGVSAIMHYITALFLTETGFSFSYVMIHQFISFYIFALFFFLFGLPAAISSHMIKNMLLYGTGPYIVGAFIFFILMDILAYRSQPSQAPRFVKKSLGI